MKDALAHFGSLANELTGNITPLAISLGLLRDGLEGVAAMARSNRAELGNLAQGMGLSATGARDMSASLKAAEERMLALSDGAKPAAEALHVVGEAASEAADKTTQSAEAMRQQAISAFTQLVTSANASSEQVREAFSQALDPELTKEQVERLEASLRVAFEAGVISAEEMGIAMTELSDKVTAAGASIEALAWRSAEAWKELQTAIKEGAAPEVIEQLQARFDLLIQRIKDAERAASGMGEAMGDAADQTMTLAGAFDVLKLKSQATLNKTRDEAALAFNTISAAAREGKAATEDVARAFELYARAAREAARYSSESVQKQVDDQLRLKGSTLGLEESLERLGLAGKGSGDQTAMAMQGAAAAVQGVADAADNASNSLWNMGGSAQSAADATQHMATSMSRVRSESATASIQLEKTSQLFKDIMAGRQKGLDFGPVGLFESYFDQNEQLERQLELLRAQNLVLDEVGQRVLELRKKFSYLSDDRLRDLAQEQIRAEQAAGQNVEQNRQLETGNDLLRERSRLMQEQTNQMTQTTTRRIEVVFDAKPAVFDIDFKQLKPSQFRDLLDQLADALRREMQVSR